MVISTESTKKGRIAATLKRGVGLDRTADTKIENPCEPINLTNRLIFG
jgi:hypothetical protein